ncbi:hypothetical protein [Streptomyces sp. NPDC003023]|uniref:hypothetical protein n=1 Tax=Streptomyces sp. NPDC003023 TaxID=3364675 RepID=UPI003675D4F6
MLPHPDYAQDGPQDEGAHGLSSVFQPGAADASATDGANLLSPHGRGLVSKLTGGPTQERRWIVTMATCSCDGRPGLHAFVVRATTAHDAYHAAVALAGTAAAVAHRRGARLDPTSAVTSLWQS